MYLCYIDESGTPQHPGNTSHYILTGLALPIWQWKKADRQVFEIKKKYLLQDSEIHTAWLLRKYLEQSRVKGFASLDYAQRRSAVRKMRDAELLRLQRSNRPFRYHQERKNQRKTDAYVHLAYEERKKFLQEVAAEVSGWGYARLFAECIDKLHFDPERAKCTAEEQAFSQVVSRFEQFLKRQGGPDENHYGLLIHDNNPTSSRRLTDLMKSFHDTGTLWTDITQIIETPLFVDSELTSMVQIADLCAYAVRRYLENEETGLFDPLFERAHRAGDVAVGVRHFTSDSCTCRICREHRIA
ncbi:MAG: DUF3800 domain-containing protein [Planctomycetes bacterium]|nr:DUF3800 domain-containing protein [Planctomycetota bacterium]